jgi:uncharacterized SAM-binding protein YcdF (DUF218 family)
MRKQPFKPMPTLIKSLLSVLPIFWLLLAVAFFFHFRGKKRAARTLFYIAIIGFLLASTGPLPRFMVKSLESRYPVFHGPLSRESNQPLHILVLGGGHTSDALLPANNQLSISALGRVIEGIRIHRQHPESLLILSGFPGRDPVSNAEVMYHAALLLGVEAENMAIIPEPENTRQEALAYREKFGSSHPLIIVTTATHIPRSMIWFRKAGLDPIAAPTNHAIKQSPTARPRWWIPSPENIKLTDRAVYEYAGIVQAKLRKSDVGVLGKSQKR